MVGDQSGAATHETTRKDARISYRDVHFNVLTVTAQPNDCDSYVVLSAQHTPFGAWSRQHMPQHMGLKTGGPTGYKAFTEPP